MMEKETEERISKGSKQNESQKDHLNVSATSAHFSLKDSSPPAYASNSQHCSPLPSINDAIPLGFLNSSAETTVNAVTSIPTLWGNPQNSHTKDVCPFSMNPSITHSSTHYTSISSNTHPSYRNSFTQNPKYPSLTASNPASTNRHSRRKNNRTPNTCSSTFNSNKVSSSSSRAVSAACIVTIHGPFKIALLAIL